MEDIRETVPTPKAHYIGEKTFCFTEPRVRMNLTQSAKGAFQLDVTVETSSVEESKMKLAEAIDAVKEVCTQKGLVLAGNAYGY